MGSHFRWNNGALNIVDLELIQVSSLFESGNRQTVLSLTDIQVRTAQKVYNIKLDIPTQQEEDNMRQAGKFF